MSATDRRRRLFWRAVHMLREAETLADLGPVAGPADSVPSEGDEESWVRDWSKRAKQALKKANEWLVEKPNKVAEERARSIADRVRRGAAAIRRAAKGAHEQLSEVQDAANKLWVAGQVGGTVVLLIAAYIAWKLWKG